MRDFSKASRLRLEKLLGHAHQVGLTVRVSLGFPARKESIPSWALSLGDHTALIPAGALRSAKSDLTLSRLPSLHDEHFFGPFLEFVSDVFALLSLYRFPEGPLVGVNIDWGVFGYDLGLTAIPSYASFLQLRYPQASQIGLRYHCNFRDFATATSAQGTRVLLDKRPWIAAYDYKFCRAQMLEERAQGVMALRSGEPLIDLISFSGPETVAVESNTSTWSIVMDPTLLEGSAGAQAYPFAPLGIMNPQATSVFRLWEYLQTRSEKEKVPMLSLGDLEVPPSPVIAVIVGRFLAQNNVRTLRQWAEQGASLYFPFGLPQYNENLATIEWKSGMTAVSKQGRIGLGKGLISFADTPVADTQFWEKLSAFSRQSSEGAGL